MRKKSLQNWLMIFLLVLILTICNVTPLYASGEGIDLNATGSISVTLCDHQTQLAVSGGEMTIYQVAEAKTEDGNISWQYVNGFENCGVDLGDLSDSRLAEELEKKISDASVGTVKMIENNGNVIFENLPVGLYLLVQTEAAEGYNAVSSFLVSVPLQDGDGWIYHVDASPKVEDVTSKTPGAPDTPKEDNKPGISKLPQTGQLNWPVPVMAMSGMLLFMIGWSMYRGKNADEA